METGGLWEISALSSQFCCEPTTALKSRGGRKTQEGGDIYIYIYICVCVCICIHTYTYIHIYNYDDSQCCTAETIQHCKAIIFQLKILKYKKML